MSQVRANSPKVTVLPATRNRFTTAPIASVKKRRVAAYARVSTDSDEQLTSYEAQVDYYTHYIKERPDWVFAGMYADEGISGTNTRRREGFNQMIADALAGKIDLIITKSVSRFARNTVDSLTTVRKLKEKGVEVYFQKENIYTLDSKGELLIIWSYRDEKLRCRRKDNAYCHAREYQTVPRACVTDHTYRIDQ